MEVPAPTPTAVATASWQKPPETTSLKFPHSLSNIRHSEPLSPESLRRSAPGSDSSGTVTISHERNGTDAMSNSPSRPTAAAAPPVSSSPVGAYPGPPPPYSSTYANIPSKAPSQAAQANYTSPPDSRRDSQEERTAAEIHAKPALPSIKEALARLPGMSPRQVPAQPPNSGTPASLHRVIDGVAGSRPNESGDRSRELSTPAFPAGLSRSYSPLPPRQLPYDPRGPPTHPPPPLNGQYPVANSTHHLSTSGHSISPIEAPPTHQQRPSPRLQTAYVNAPQGHYYNSTVSSPQNLSNHPLSAKSTNGAFPPAPAPPTSHPFSQAPPPHASHAYTFPPPQSSGLTYEQSLQQASLLQSQRPLGGHFHSNPEFDKVDERRRAAAASQLEHPPYAGSYGMTVKRHLDDFDLENNLNDIAEKTGRIMEFSRQYGVKAHQYPRSTIPVTELPKLEECDRMIEDASELRTALDRLRKVVEQQTRAAEQSSMQQSYSTKPGVPGFASFGPESNGVANGYAGSDKGIEQGDGAAGGFAGADAKKRRGRNAPPGRCHSCNRVETPEWRRGPDGARTLCNACGLHYAKLTRKLGKENKAAADAAAKES